MKKEVYSCLKMLEALNVNIKTMWFNDLLHSVSSLREQYAKISSLLKKHLSEEESEMIPIVEYKLSGPYVSENDTKRNLLQKLMTASEITIAYLRSLDMDLNKEVMEIKKKKEEVESKTKEVELQKAYFEKIISILQNGKEGIPELIRSGIVGKIKENHRIIEKNTNPNTKSQKSLKQA